MGYRFMVCDGIIYSGSGLSFFIPSQSVHGEYEFYFSYNAVLACVRE